MEVFNQRLAEVFVTSALKFSFQYKPLIDSCGRQENVHKRFVQLLFNQQKGSEETDFNLEHLIVSRDNAWY